MFARIGRSDGGEVSQAVRQMVRQPVAHGRRGDELSMAREVARFGVRQQFTQRVERREYVHGRMHDVCVCLLEILEMLPGRSGSR